jgi:hypothetical protein
MTRLQQQKKVISDSIVVSSYRIVGDERKWRMSYLHFVAAGVKLESLYFVV